jgi:tetratricopeptide (TPR) repeat protein
VPTSFRGVPFSQTFLGITLAAVIAGVVVLLIQKHFFEAETGSKITDRPAKPPRNEAGVDKDQALADPIKRAERSFEQGNFKKAITEFTESLDIKDTQHANLGLAKAYASDGQTDLALKLLTRMINEREYCFIEGYQERGMVYRRLGNEAAATKDLEKSAKCNADAWARYRAQQGAK